MISLTNGEGYPDPTAYYALTKIEREEFWRLKKNLKDDLNKVCEKYGYCLGDIVMVVEKESGDVYKL